MGFRLQGAFGRGLWGASTGHQFGLRRQQHEHESPCLRLRHPAKIRLCESQTATLAKMAEIKRGFTQAMRNACSLKVGASNMPSCSLDAFFVAPSHHALTVTAPRTCDILCFFFFFYEMRSESIDYCLEKRLLDITCGLNLLPFGSTTRRGGSREPCPDYVVGLALRTVLRTYAFQRSFAFVERVRIQCWVE